jgi:hypothetical protein
MNQHFAAVAFTNPVSIKQFIDMQEKSHSQYRSVQFVILDVVAILQLVKNSLV